MKNIKYEQINYQMTEKLLRMISERTPGRKDFNQLEYEVIITEDQHIVFHPAKCIYRNNKNDVKYTTEDMIAKILDDLENFKYFTPGKYRYCYYTSDKSRRHWIKEESR